MPNSLLFVLVVVLYFLKNLLTAPISVPQIRPINSDISLSDSIDSIELYALNDKQTLAETSFRDISGSPLARNKRAVGMLRVFFPEITKNLDDAVDKILAQLLHVLAPIFLRNGGLSLGGGLTRNSEVTVDLGDNFDDNDDFDIGESSNNSSNNDNDSNKVTTLSTVNENFLNEIDDNKNSTLVGDDIEFKKKKRRNIRSISNKLVKNEQNIVSVDDNIDEEYEDEHDDTIIAGSENILKKNSNLSKVDFDDNDDETDSRNKRYSNSFGNANSVSNSNSGGSGNFLFDILRLISGGSSPTPTDNSDGTDSDFGAGKSTGILVGTSDVQSFKPIPGPITRLFVIANRSIANLMQDLILRLAETSERLVNFKARLITALI